MKLRGPDGVVREFHPSKEGPNGVTEAICWECYEQLGANDLKFTKPRMKKHVCEEKALKYAKKIKRES